MWGTDWTRAVGLLTYKQGVEAFRVTDRLSDSERAALMGGTLAEGLRLGAGEGLRDYCLTTSFEPCRDRRNNDQRLPPVAMPST